MHALISSQIGEGVVSSKDMRCGIKLKRRAEGLVDDKQKQQSQT